MNHTSIMATMADVRCSANFVQALRQAGMDAVRINSAHVTPETIVRMVSTIRAVDPEIKILMDTKGPEIRTADNAEPISIAVGDEVIITSSHHPSVQRRISVMVDDMHRIVQPGNHIIIDDGAFDLEVTEIKDCDIHTVARRAGGALGARKTVNVPGVEVPPLPAVSERDRENIRAACAAGIDMIAHSFVRTPSDVEAVRAELSGTDVKLYAKIECRSALEHLDAIMQASDGLLVARGDLGTQIPLSAIPLAQYQIIAHCRQAGKPVIVATQILQSMIAAPTPTRAEVNDIALAVMEGADTLLLCGETAQGAYPTECVAMMRETINEIENAGLRCKIKID